MVLERGRARSLRLLALCWLGLCLATTSVRAQRAAREPDDPVFTPSPLQDDAQLHDVHLLPGGQAWAVGDHGTIWHSPDGGGRWRLQPGDTSASLHSVWFINRREGWIVGGETEPVTHRSHGVVLHTTDGGLTWDQLWPRTAAADERHPKQRGDTPAPLPGGSFQFQIGRAHV